jgi:hypothetical protein
MLLPLLSGGATLAAIWAAMRHGSQSGTGDADAEARRALQEHKRAQQAAAEALEAEQKRKAAAAAAAEAEAKRAAAERQQREAAAAAAAAAAARDAAAAEAARKKAQNAAAAAAAAAAIAQQKEDARLREEAAAEQAKREAERQNQIRIEAERKWREQQAIKARAAAEAARAAAEAKAAAQRAIEARKEAARKAAEEAARKAAEEAARKRQQQPPAPDPAPSPAPNPHAKVETAANALRSYLVRNAGVIAAFGWKGHPSDAVAMFQRVVKANMIRDIAVDGILGPQVRGAGRMVGVNFPPRPQQGAAPTPTPTPTPTPPLPAPAPRPPTPGFDPALARELAPQIERHLRQAIAKGNKYGYSRALVKRFQAAAALRVDGHYGGATRGALLYFGAIRAPKPFFKPTHTIKYTPPA